MSAAPDEARMTCPICCDEEPREMMLLDCGHSFCNPCLVKELQRANRQMDSIRRVVCSYCRLISPGDLINLSKVITSSTSSGNPGLLTPISSELQAVQEPALLAVMDQSDYIVTAPLAPISSRFVSLSEPGTIQAAADEPSWPNRFFPLPAALMTGTRVDAATSDTTALATPTTLQLPLRSSSSGIKVDTRPPLSSTIVSSPGRCNDEMGSGQRLLQEHQLGLRALGPLPPADVAVRGLKLKPMSKWLAAAAAVAAAVTGVSSASTSTSTGAATSANPSDEAVREAALEVLKWISSPTRSNTAPTPAVAAGNAEKRDGEDILFNSKKARLVSTSASASASAPGTAASSEEFSGETQTLALLLLALARAHSSSGGAPLAMSAVTSHAVTQPKRPQRFALSSSSLAPASSNLAVDELELPTLDSLHSLQSLLILLPVLSAHALNKIRSALIAPSAAVSLEGDKLPWAPARARAALAWNRRRNYLMAPGKAVGLSRQRSLAKKREDNGTLGDIAADIEVLRKVVEPKSIEPQLLDELVWAKMASDPEVSSPAHLASLVASLALGNFSQDRIVAEAARPSQGPDAMLWRYMPPPWMRWWDRRCLFWCCTRRSKTCEFWCGNIRSIGAVINPTQGTWESASDDDDDGADDTVVITRGESMTYNPSPMGDGLSSLPYALPALLRRRLARAHLCLDSGSCPSVAELQSCSRALARVSLSGLALLGRTTGWMRPPSSSHALIFDVSRTDLRVATKTFARESSLVWGPSLQAAIAASQARAQARSGSSGKRAEPTGWVRRPAKTAAQGKGTGDDEADTAFIAALSLRGSLSGTLDPLTGLLPEAELESDDAAEAAAKAALHASPTNLGVSKPAEVFDPNLSFLPLPGSPDYPPLSQTYVCAHAEGAKMLQASAEAWILAWHNLFNATAPSAAAAERCFPPESLTTGAEALILPALTAAEVNAAPFRLSDTLTPKWEMFWQLSSKMQSGGSSTDDDNSCLGSSTIFPPARPWAVHSARASGLMPLLPAISHAARAAAVHRAGTRAGKLSPEALEATLSVLAKIQSSAKLALNNPSIIWDTAKATAAVLRGYSLRAARFHTLPLDVVLSLTTMPARTWTRLIFGLPSGSSRHSRPSGGSLSTVTVGYLEGPALVWMQPVVPPAAAGAGGWRWAGGFGKGEGVVVHIMFLPGTQHAFSPRKTGSGLTDGQPGLLRRGWVHATLTHRPQSHFSPVDNSKPAFRVLRANRVTRGLSASADPMALVLQALGAPRIPLPPPLWGGMPAAGAQDPKSPTLRLPYPLQISFPESSVATGPAMDPNPLGMFSPSDIDSYSGLPTATVACSTLQTLDALPSEFVSRSGRLDMCFASPQLRALWLRSLLLATKVLPSVAEGLAHACAYGGNGTTRDIDALDVADRQNLAKNDNNLRNDLNLSSSTSDDELSTDSSDGEHEDQALHICQTRQRVPFSDESLTRLMQFRRAQRSEKKVRQQKRSGYYHPSLIRLAAFLPLASLRLAATLVSTAYPLPTMSSVITTTAGSAASAMSAAAALAGLSATEATAAAVHRCILRRSHPSAERVRGYDITTDILKLSRSSSTLPALNYHEIVQQWPAVSLEYYMTHMTSRSKASTPPPSTAASVASASACYGARSDRYLLLLAPLARAERARIAAWRLDFLASALARMRRARKAAAAVAAAAERRIQLRAEAGAAAAALVVSVVSAVIASVATAPVLEKLGLASSPQGDPYAPDTSASFAYPAPDLVAPAQEPGGRTYMTYASSPASQGDINKRCELNIVGATKKAGGTEKGARAGVALRVSGSAVVHEWLQLLGTFTPAPPLALPSRTAAGAGASPKSTTCSRTRRAAAIARATAAAVTAAWNFPTGPRSAAVTDSEGDKSSGSTPSRSTAGARAVAVLSRMLCPRSALPTVAAAAADDCLSCGRPRGFLTTGNKSTYPPLQPPPWRDELPLGACGCGASSRAIQEQRRCEEAQARRRARVRAMRGATKRTAETVAAAASSQTEGVDADLDAEAALRRTLGLDSASDADSEDSGDASDAADVSRRARDNPSFDADAAAVVAALRRVGRVDSRDAGMQPRAWAALAAVTAAVPAGPESGAAAEGWGLPVACLSLVAHAAAAAAAAERSQHGAPPTSAFGSDTTPETAAARHQDKGDDADIEEIIALITTPDAVKNLHTMNKALARRKMSLNTSLPTLHAAQSAAEAAVAAAEAEALAAEALADAAEKAAAADEAAAAAAASAIRYDNGTIDSL